MDAFYEALMQPGVELADLIVRPSWHEHAACRGLGPATFSGIFQL